MGLVVELWPFRFAVHADGLIVRTGRAEHRLPWGDIEAVILDQPRPWSRRPPRSMRLLLVPAAGADPPERLAEHSPVDGRACLELLDLETVKEAPGLAAEALARFGGGRFVDATGLRRGHFRPDLGTAILGYRRRWVDELLWRSREALRSGDGRHRRAVAAALESAGPPLALGGCDAVEVKALRRELVAELAKDPGAEPWRDDRPWGDDEPRRSPVFSDWWPVPDGGPGPGAGPTLRTPLPPADR